MAVLRITNFGGEVPSASARAVPAESARVARNLLSRVSEFRPLGSDTQVATTADLSAPSLYRLTRNAAGGLNTDVTQNWITSATRTSFVRGQVNDDATERTYTTVDDGSVLPRVFNAQGLSKPLGVPAPTTISALAVPSDEYSDAEDQLARVELPTAVFTAVKASLSSFAGGNPPTQAPGAHQPGWIAHGSQAGLPTTNAGDWAFLAPMLAASSGGYVMEFPAQTDFLLSTEFAGQRITYAGLEFWAVPVAMQGIGYSVNTATLTAGLKVLKNPADGTQLVTDASAASTAAVVAALYLPTAAPQASSIAALNAAQAALQQAVAASGNQAALQSTLQAFYAKADVNSQITTAIANFAAAIVAIENELLHPTAYAPV